MCGAYFTYDGPRLEHLEAALKVDHIPATGLRVPTQPIPIVTQTPEGSREVHMARWWLLLRSDGEPDSRYATFNSRWDKLHSSTLTKGLYCRSRCVIPATGFIEGQDGHYHQLARPDQGIAFGGLLREIEVDGETRRSASIITCPGNPQMADIHRKSLPLMLPAENHELIDDWLNPQITDTDRFDWLLNGKLQHELAAVPIEGARQLNPTGDSILLERDS